MKFLLTTVLLRDPSRSHRGRDSPPFPNELPH